MNGRHRAILRCRPYRRRCRGRESSASSRSTVVGSPWRRGAWCRSVGGWEQPGGAVVHARFARLLSFFALLMTAVIVVAPQTAIAEAARPQRFLRIRRGLRSSTAGCTSPATHPRPGTNCGVRTAATIELVADLWPGEESSFPIDLEDNGWLDLLRSGRPDTGDELWRTDGATTELVADISPAAWLTPELRPRGDGWLDLLPPRGRPRTRQ